MNKTLVFQKFTCGFCNLQKSGSGNVLPPRKKGFPRVGKQVVCDECFQIRESIKKAFCK